MWKPFTQAKAFRQSHQTDVQSDVQGRASRVPVTASTDQWIKLVVRAVLLFITIGVVVQYAKIWRAPASAFTIDGPACAAVIAEP